MGKYIFEAAVSYVPTTSNCEPLANFLMQQGNICQQYNRFNWLTLKKKRQKLRTFNGNKQFSLTIR
jgi:hypothetical protein